MNDHEWLTVEDKDRCFGPACYNKVQKWKDFCSHRCALRYYLMYGGKFPQPTEYKEKNEGTNP